MGTTTLSVEPYRRTVLMLVLFVVLLVVGRWTRLSDSHVALLWPAAGVGVWWFLGRRSPVRRATEAALLVSAAGAVYLLSGAPLAVAGALSLVNLAHAGVGAWLVQRSGVDRWGLRRPSGPVRLLIASLTAGLVAALLAAAVAATLLDDSVLAIFVLVWVRNTTGTFLVLVLVFGVTRPQRVHELVTGRRLGEWCAALLLGLLLYGVVFGLLPGLPLMFVVLPLWVWAGVRLGLARTSVLSVVTGVLAVVLTLQGYGVASTIALPPARAAAIQAFLLVTVLTSTMLACLQEERERIGAALTAARLTLSASIDAALIGSSLVVAQGQRVGQMLRPNPALRRLLRTEATPHAVDGAPQRALETGWLSYLRPANRTAVQEVLAHIDAGVRQDWTGELDHQLADGSVVWAEVHLSVLPMYVTDGDSVLPVHVTDDDPARGPVGGPTDWPPTDVPDHPRVVVAQFLDITARKDAEAQLVHLALHDELTGLANRVLLRDRVELALGAARRSRSQVALIFFDLDHFKNINDSLGHNVGDDVLTVVAQRMRAALRPADTVARVGGDEFVVCCPDVTDRREAEELAQRLVVAVSEPVWVQDRFVPVGVSAGLTLSQVGDDAATLLKQGDAAMYAAKRSGRGRVSSFSQALRRRRAGTSPCPVSSVTRWPWSSSSCTTSPSSTSSQGP